VISTPLNEAIGKLKTSNRPPKKLINILNISVNIYFTIFHNNIKGLNTAKTNTTIKIIVNIAYINSYSIGKVPRKLINISLIVGNI
jgi:hypothetical protein